MRSLKAESVYAAGDSVDGSGPKSGRKAIARGRIAANNVAARLTRTGPVLQFRGHDTRCLVDLGGHRAMYLSFADSGRPDSERVRVGWMPYLAKTGPEKLHLARRGNM